MSTPREPDDILMAWLEEGPTRLPSETRRAIVVGLPSVTQRRHLSWVPWRFPTMSAPVRLAAAIAFIAIVGVAGLNFLRPAVGPGSAPLPSPSPTPTVTSSPQPTPPGTAGWSTYTSSQYGFAIGYPADWAPAPATRAWTFEADGMEFITPGADRFQGPSVEVSAWMVPFEPGVTEDTLDIVAWVEQYCAQTFNESCAGIRDRAEPMCNEVRDCHAALLVPFPTEVQAFFTGGNFPADRMTIVTVWRPEDHTSTARYGGSKALLLAFLSTMGVVPQP